MVSSVCTFGAGEKLPRPFDALFGCVLVGQAGTALCTAAGKDFTPVAGSHALAETMLLGALTLFGLVGTKHREHLLRKISSRRSGQQQPGRLRFVITASLIIDDTRGICQLKNVIFFNS